MESPSPQRFDYNMIGKSSSVKKSGTRGDATRDDGMSITGTGGGLRRRTNMNMNMNMSSNLNATGGATNLVDDDFAFRPPPKMSLMMSSFGMVGAGGMVQSNNNNNNNNSNGSNMDNATTNSAPQTTNTTTTNVNANGTTSSSTSTALIVPTVTQDEMNNLDDDDDEYEEDMHHLGKWVVVIFGSNTSLMRTIQQRFESYGTIVAIHTPASTTSISSTSAAAMVNGNWICIKYKSRLEAEKAICQDGTFHSAIIPQGRASRGSGGAGGAGAGGSYNQSYGYHHRQGCILIGVKRLSESIAQKLGVDIYASDYTNSYNHEYGNHYDNSMPSALSTDANANANAKVINGNYGNEREQHLRQLNNKRKNYNQQHAHAEDEDILLGAERSYAHVTKRVAGNSVCEKVLSWIFMWD